jgi:hypothetical protein
MPQKISKSDIIPAGFVHRETELAFCGISQ